jgi:hypothetical protein
MANRHSHKKLRADIHLRMATTGETYQTARHRILFGRAPREQGEDVDLVATEYFGVPITLAIFPAIEPLGRPAIVHVPSARAETAQRVHRTPLMMVRPKGVQ